MAAPAPTSVATPSAAGSVIIDVITSPRHCETAPCHHGFGQLVSPGAKDPAHGLPGNIHDIGRLCLIQAVIINQSHSLELLQGQDHFFGRHDSPGDKLRYPGNRIDISGSFGSWHGRLLFDHLTII
jgi:hypothetical protein